MESKRPIVELLVILKQKEHLFELGICGWVHRLHEYKIINSEELDSLLEYVWENDPRWLTNLLGITKKGKGFYWQSEEIKPRLKWIDRHINKLGKRVNQYYGPL